LPSRHSTATPGPMISVNVAGVEAGPHRLELLPHRLRPRLGTQDPVAKLDPVDQPALPGALSEEQAEGRRARDPVRTEVGEQLELKRHVSARRRHHGCSEALTAVMEAEPAREQPIPVGHVKNVSGRTSRTRDRARVDLGEKLDVAHRVRDDGRLAMRTRGRVHPHRLFERNREHPERKRVA